MALDVEQKGIVRGVLPAAFVSATTIIVALCTQFMAMSGDWDCRAHVWALSLIAPTLALLHAIARVANHRFDEPLDRNAAAAETRTPRLEMLQAILRNTHEQAFVALLIYSIGAVLLPPHLLDALPYCSALFLIGRIAFTVGYPGGGPGRAFGFGLTFYPSAMLGLLILGSTIF